MRVLLVGAILGAGALALGGCAVDQGGEVEEYRRLTDIGPPEAFVEGESLALDKAIRLAGAYNEDLGIAGEQYLRLVIERRRRVSALLPTLDMFGDLGLRENTGASDIASVDVGFAGRYVFPTGLGDRRDLEAAEIDVVGGQWALLDAREGLLLEAARAYYEAMRAESLIDVLEASLEVQNERLRDIQGRQAVGFARPLDVAQIEAQASATRVLLIDAGRAAARSRSALVFVTGVEAGASELSDGLVIPPADAEVEELLRLAEAGRGDLLATRADAAAARERVDAAMSQYYPTVGIDLDWFLYRESGSDDLDLTSLIAVNLPLFSGGRIDADVREAWSVFRESVLRHQGARRQVRFEVEAALNDLRASRLRVAELDIQVAAARETLRQAEAVFAGGRGTNLERIQAQAAQIEAEVNRVSEGYTLKLAYLSLRRVIGMLAADVGAAPMPEGAGEEFPVPQSPFVRVAPASGERDRSGAAAWGEGGSSDR